MTNRTRRRPLSVVAALVIATTGVLHLVQGHWTDGCQWLAIASLVIVADVE